jgi:hypothetical protein
VRTADARGVGFIHDDLRSEFIGELKQIADRSTVAIHAEEGFGDDHLQDGMLRVSAQLMLQEVEITMRVDDFLGAGEGSGRQGCESSKVKVLVPSIACITE